MGSWRTRVRLIGGSRKKDDRLDPRTRKHRSAIDLTVIRARAGLVRSRTALINTAWDLAKRTPLGEKNNAVANPAESPTPNPQRLRCLWPEYVDPTNFAMNVSPDFCNQQMRRNDDEVRRGFRKTGKGTALSLLCFGLRV